LVARRVCPALLALTLAEAARAQQVVEVQVAPPSLRLRVDAQTQLLATAYDEAGNPVEAPIRWASTNINVVQVNSEGLVRAVAPGVAIITATAGGAARRRSGRVTVHVLMEPPVMAHPVHPAPQAAPAPAAPPAPGAPVPPRAPLPPRMVNVDSIIRASVNCEEPFVNAVNPARACWERRPMPRQSPMVALPEQCGGRPAAAGMLVRVGERGEVEAVRLFRPSTCPEFDSAAVAHARTLSFEPAQRDGRPTRAWIQLQLRSLRSGAERRP
jgi:TonB family protein